MFILNIRQKKKKMKNKTKKNHNSNNRTEFRDIIQCHRVTLV